MANADHLQILEQGVEAWNQWRQDNPDAIPDLDQAKLNDKDLSEINLSNAQLRKANFCRSKLIDADLSRSNFSGATFFESRLDNANFSHSKASIVIGEQQVVFLRFIGWTVGIFAAAAAQSWVTLFSGQVAEQYSLLYILSLPLFTLFYLSLLRGVNKFSISISAIILLFSVLSDEPAFLAIFAYSLISTLVSPLYSLSYGLLHSSINSLFMRYESFAGMGLYLLWAEYIAHSLPDNDYWRVVGIGAMIVTWSIRVGDVAIFDYLIKLSDYVYIRPVLERFKINFASFGGTSFERANLANTNFECAEFIFTSFNRAYIDKANFYKSKGLETSKLDGTILLDADVRDLLAGRKVRDEYAGKSFRGACLKARKDLKGIDLSECDFTDASLDGADLSHSNLSRVCVARATLRNTILTGACIEDWHYNSQTVLRKAVCKYIFFKYNYDARKFDDRRPSDHDSFYSENEFSMLFQKSLEIIDSFFLNGMDSMDISSSPSYDITIIGNPSIFEKDVRSEGDLVETKVVYSEQLE